MENREELRGKFLSREFHIEEEDKVFLNLFPEFKKVIEEHGDTKKLYYYDCGGNFGCDWVLGTKDGSFIHRIGQSVEHDRVESKIYELYPKTEEDFNKEKELFLKMKRIEEEERLERIAELELLNKTQLKKLLKETKSELKEHRTGSSILDLPLKEDEEMFFMKLEREQDEYLVENIELIEGVLNNK